MLMNKSRLSVALLSRCCFAFIVYKKQQINGLKINIRLVYKKLENFRKKKQSNSRSTAVTLYITTFANFCCSAVDETLTSHMFLVYR